MEVDGNIVYFNEAEAVAALDGPEEDKVKTRGRKSKGKRAADIQGLPVIPVEHKMTEEELLAEFGENGWYQLEDEIYCRYRFTPMKHMDDYDVSFCEDLLPWSDKLPAKCRKA